MITDPHRPAKPARNAAARPDDGQKPRGAPSSKAERPPEQKPWAGGAPRTGPREAPRCRG